MIEPAQQFHCVVLHCTLSYRACVGRHLAVLPSGQAKYECCAVCHMGAEHRRERYPEMTGPRFKRRVPFGRPKREESVK